MESDPRDHTLLSKLPGREGQPTRILVVEDNPGDYRLIAECFRESIQRMPAEITNAATLTDALAILSNRETDIVLLDLSLPDSFGLDTFRSINKIAPKLPIVVLSGNENEDLAAEIVKLGAQDSLSKDFLGSPVAAPLIRRTVRHAIERKSAHETLKAMQMQLIQAEKLEGIGRLAAGVAHEVRNPLARVLLGIEYLQGGIEADDPNLPIVLERMASAVDRADTILRGMLDFASDRGLTLENTDVNALLTSSLLLLEHELKSKGINVAREFEEGLPTVSMDSRKMEQVIINLVMNSIHAMEGRDKRELTIKTSSEVIEGIESNQGARTREHLRSGDRVVSISIKDTGGGIPKESLANIWDPFFTTKPTGIGTGLGLSVTRKIMDLHQGQITLVNTEDGAIATISIKTGKFEP
ncbi:MAG: response regulator [Verrucomicrobiae bacterium]|nr:response regulator [Verrucomicrobiae bacterium]